MPLNWTKRDTLFLLIAAVLVSIYVLRAGGGFPLDDSWIHQTYGRNLALLGEWSFLPGVPSAASTSPLYTVLLAIGYRLSIPYIWWTNLLGILALTGIAVIGAQLAQRALPQQPRAGWITGMALLFSWHLIWVASSGMETAIFAMLTLGVLLLGWQHSESLPDALTGSLLRKGFSFGVLVALTTLARPEGILAGGLAGLGVLLALIRQHKKPLFVWMLAAVGGFLIAILPYLVLNLQLTGGLLPNTANAKFVQHAVMLALPYPYRFYKLAEAIFAGGQVLLLPGIFAYMFLRWKHTPAEKQFAAFTPLLWSIGLIALYAARLPAWYQHGRYVIPALPALVVCGVVGMLWLHNHLTRRSRLLPRVGLRVLTISTVVLFGIFAAWGIEIFRTDVLIIDSEMVAAARWIDENLPPDELLAIHDIGAVGYFTPRPMLDIAGLLSPEVIERLNDPEKLWELMQERDARYLMAFANQVPGGDVNDPRLCMIFTTDAEITRQSGGTNMTIYQLDWNATCDG